MNLLNFDKIDGFFGVIPFHTFSNEIQTTKEITSRKTYLGYEDNDHRYIKAKEITLNIVFFGILALPKKMALESLWEKADKQVLILLKRHQVFKTMVIKDIHEVQEYNKDGENVIELSVTFQEMRYGVPSGNIFEEVKNVTTQDGMFTQIIGVGKEKLKTLVNLYSRLFGVGGK